MPSTDRLALRAAEDRRVFVQPLPEIDRDYPGFGDFSVAGARAIEPGSPDRSLLYHALASPTVVADREGVELGGFPSLAEIEAVENYIYGVAPPTLDELRERANGRRLGIGVFAPQYQNAPMRRERPASAPSGLPRSRAFSKSRSACSSTACTRMEPNRGRGRTESKTAIFSSSRGSRRIRPAEAVWTEQAGPPSMDSEPNRQNGPP